MKNAQRTRIRKRKEAALKIIKDLGECGRAEAILSGLRRLTTAACVRRIRSSDKPGDDLHWLLRTFAPRTAERLSSTVRFHHKNLVWHLLREDNEELLNDVVDLLRVRLGFVR